jgi:hypothetical protein
MVGMVMFLLLAPFCIESRVPQAAPMGQEQSEPVLNDVIPPNILEKSTQEIIKDFPQLEGLQPVSDQQDLPMILKKVGENVQVYFHNFVSTSAQEEVIQQRLRPNGKVDGFLKQKFHYLLVSSGRHKDFDLDEYRMDKKGRPVNQKVFHGGTLTKGFASMPALLHPELQPQSQFNFLGRQKKHGLDLFVVAFAEDPERAEFRERIVGELGTHIAYLQGLVWVDPDSFQIVQMSTQLLPGTYNGSLIQQTTTIDFSQVQFQGISASYWLPREVEVVTSRLDGLHRNYHRYSDYQLYASQTKMIVQPQ